MSTKVYITARLSISHDSIKTLMKSFSEFSTDSLNIKFSLEQELLLCCSHIQISPENLKQIHRLLKQKINWNYLIKLSIQHGVTPLLYKTLKTACAEYIPEDVLDQLRVLSHGIALRNTIFAKELLETLDLLTKEGISAIPFKGPVLAQSIYGNLSLRDFCDIDILVHPDNFLKAIDILINRGSYKAHRQWRFLNDIQELLYIGSFGEFSLRKGIVFIDLHQFLTVERFMTKHFTFNYLWNRKESLSFAGQTLWSLSSEDLLLYLCIHGSKDCWRRLKWVCDIAECIRFNPNVNWQSIIDQAIKLGCERMLLLGLKLAQDILKIALPKIVCQKIKLDLECQKLAREFSIRLFWEGNNLGRRFTLEKFLIHLRMMNTLEGKLSCFGDIRRPIYSEIVKIIPNNKDRDFFLLPRSLYLFYYFVRPVRILKKWLNANNER